MALEVDVVKKYESFRLDVTFTVNNHVLGLLGSSGSGKSLTLRMIAGIETPDEGRIVLNDRVLFDSDTKTDIRVRNRNTALLFQNYQLFPTMTVAKNILSGMKRELTKSERLEKLVTLLNLFRLNGLEKNYPCQLSGGQQQRVALARMLASNPEILMFDEPFSALDETLKVTLEPEITQMIDEFGGSVLYVSHDIEEAYRFCDKIAVIDNGLITDVGQARRIIHKPQSLAAMKLSGFRNISRCKKIGEKKVVAQDWGIELDTQDCVADDVKYVGIREHEVMFEKNLDDNCFKAEAIVTTDSIFRNQAVFYPKRFMDKDYIRHVRAQVYFEYSKESRVPDIVEGESYSLALPPDKLHLVSK